MRGAGGGSGGAVASTTRCSASSARSRVLLRSRSCRALRASKPRSRMAAYHISCVQQGREEAGLGRRRAADASRRGIERGAAHLSSWAESRMGKRDRRWRSTASR